MAHKGKSDQEVQAMYAIFLRVLFDKATEKVAAIGEGKTGAELASAWAGYLKEDMDTEGIAPHKQAFLNEVVAESKVRTRSCTMLRTNESDRTNLEAKLLWPSCSKS